MTIARKVPNVCLRLPTIHENINKVQAPLLALNMAMI